MTDHQSDAELHMERLVKIASEGSAADRRDLPLYDLKLVLLAHLRYEALRCRMDVWRLNSAPGT